MFSGIVQEISSVKRRSKIGSVVVIEIVSSLRSVVGSSVLVNGICSTIARKQKNLLQFEYVQETQSKTTINQWKTGTPVNLEPSLRLSDEISGHLVMGHVDGVGTIKSIKKNKNDVVLTVRVKKSLQKFIASKGSVCIDGVSLTIVETKGDQFSVALIPHTLKVTTLKNLKKGDAVNIEIDILARYVSNFIHLINSHRSGRNVLK